jgi:hypothetical protein
VGRRDLDIACARQDRGGFLQDLGRIVRGEGGAAAA